MSVWDIYFSWPQGQVWPNLVASAVTSASAVAVFLWRVLKRMDQHHEARMAQDREHHRQTMQAVRGGDH